MCIRDSNKVENEPPVIKPSKQDTQKDPTINIDGKTALLGDKVYYRVNIDASRLTDTAYKAVSYTHLPAPSAPPKHSPDWAIP